jgi:hypothetical protein
MKLFDVTNYLGITNVQPKMEQAQTTVVNRDGLGPKEVFLQWEAQSRVHKKGLNKKMSRTMIVIGAVISLFLAVMGEFFLILVVGSIIFMSYVLSVTPPENVSYEISNYGIMFGEQMFYWDQLKQYFFSYSSGQELLCVDSKESLPGRVFISIRAGDKDKIKDILSRYLAFLKEEPVTVMDKTYKSFTDKFNF